MLFRSDREKDCPDYIEAINNNAVEIARYTRYEGQTAEELGKERWNVVAMRNAAIERAEAAETKVKGLADQLEYWRPHAIELEAKVRELKEEVKAMDALIGLQNEQLIYEQNKVRELKAEIGRMKEEREQDGMEKDLNT